jgi:hypothetical protein
MTTFAMVEAENAGIIEWLAVSSGKFSDEFRQTIRLHLRCAKSQLHFLA